MCSQAPASLFLGAFECLALSPEAQHGNDTPAEPRATEGTGDVSDPARCVRTDWPPCATKDAEAAVTDPRGWGERSKPCLLLRVPHKEDGREVQTASMVFLVYFTSSGATVSMPLFS